MDLAIQLEGIKLNIRVAMLIKTSRGYLFEKSKDGYYFTIGGRIKINESSQEATQREVQEEIGYNIKDIKLVSIVENFFKKGDSNIQEICFVYNHEEVVEIDLPSNFVEIEKNDLVNMDIRPEIMKKIITDSKDEISHYIVK